MPNKRHRDETSEQVNPYHKRFIKDNGDAQRVNPMRYENNDNINYSYVIPYPTDDKKDNYPNNTAMNNNNNNNDTELGLLLYELASLNVEDKNENNNNDRQIQTCPICSIRLSLSEFADHVHECLDKLDANYRNYLRTQIEKDCDFANEYAISHGYVKDYGTQCPICNKQLVLGCGMNEHINKCADKQEMEDEDDDINYNNNNNNNNETKQLPLNREQMIQCAAKLMTLQQGTQQFDNMLDMFGALGFNKQNVKSVLEIEKNQSNKNNNNNNNDFVEYMIEDDDL